jgi:hypothetical protein
VRFTGEGNTPGTARADCNITLLAERPYYSNQVMGRDSINFADFLCRNDPAGGLTAEVKENAQRIVRM